MDEPQQHPEARLPPRPLHGRGTAARPDPRFDAHGRERTDYGWPDEAPAAAPATTVIADTARQVITRNDSPDVPFDRSINPYRGCEHGCIYCYARPSHAWLGLSPGIDFETRIACKPDAAARLREELARPGYRPSPIALGVNTDAWQPLERRLGITRALLEVLAECRHPVTLVTKSALIERDLDLLAGMARENLVHASFSVTTLDPELARRLEPRAAQPQRRLAAMRRLHEAGIPVGVMFAPLVPGLNDHELEAVLAAAKEAGASASGYVLLRLPHEVAGLFRDWLAQHAPGRAAKVMSLVRQLRGGRDNDPRFGSRMHGEGEFARLFAQRHRLAARRLGLDAPFPALDSTRFVPPKLRRGQLDLF